MLYLDTAKGKCPALLSGRDVGKKEAVGGKSFLL